MFPGWQVEMVPLGREILLGRYLRVPCMQLLDTWHVSGNAIELSHLW